MDQALPAAPPNPHRVIRILCYYNIARTTVFDVSIGTTSCFSYSATPSSCARISFLFDLTEVTAKTSGTACLWLLTVDPVESFIDELYE